MQPSLFKFQSEDISPVEKSIHFEIPVPYLQKKWEQAYRKVAKEAEIPGFRKGKAPKAMLEHYYKKQVASDMFADVFEETFNEWLEKEQVQMIGQPVLESRSDLLLDQPLTYKVRIETYPKVELHTYEGFVVNERSPQVTPEEVEKELQQKRERFTELTAIIDRDILAETDIVTLEAKGHIGTQPYHEKKLSVDLSLPKEAPLPGLVEALVGIRIDAKNQTLAWTIPQDQTGGPTEEKVELVIDIQSAHQKNLPTLDDEFAKDTGEADTLTELREKIRAALLKRDSTRAKREMHERLIDELIKHNPVPLPPSLVKRVAQDYLKERRYELIMRALEKMPRDEKMTPQFLLEIAQDMAKKDLALQFLVRTIAEKSNLEITDAEIEKRLVEWAHQEGTSVPRLKSKIEREDPNFSNVRAQLLVEKVITLIESTAQIHKEPPSIPG